MVSMAKIGLSVRLVLDAPDVQGLGLGGLQSSPNAGQIPELVGCVEELMA